MWIAPTLNHNSHDLRIAEVGGGVRYGIVKSDEKALAISRAVEVEGVGSVAILADSANPHAIKGKRPVTAALRILDDARTGLL